MPWWDGECCAIRSSLSVVAFVYQALQGVLEGRLRQGLRQLMQMALALVTERRARGGGNGRRLANLHAYLNYSNLMPELLEVF